MHTSFRTVRLVPGDTALARKMFATMAVAFGEAVGDVSDDYVAGLLMRRDFWAIGALEGDEVIGGLTAHTLPMTRAPAAEVFVYDIATHEDRRRRGVGRRLVAHLREAALAEGIETVFVAADDADEHAIDFYRAMGGKEAPVTFFTFEP